MNIWTTSLIGANYYCSLSHLMTFKENQNHEIIGEFDPPSSEVKCHFSDEKILLSNDSPLSNKKRVKNLLKTGCFPIIKDKVFNLEKIEFCAQEMLHQYCRKAIQRLRLLVQRDEANLPETLLCPITLDLFEDPVIDDHGHTFERSAIEQHLQQSDHCPLNRESIFSLSPNRSMKDLIDKMRTEQLIPLLPAMYGKMSID